jgi:hypothetical protein
MPTTMGTADSEDRRTPAHEQLGSKDDADGKTSNSTEANHKVTAEELKKDCDQHIGAMLGGVDGTLRVLSDPAAPKTLDSDLGATLLCGLVACLLDPAKSESLRQGLVQLPNIWEHFPGPGQLVNRQVDDTAAKLNFVTFKTKEAIQQEQTPGTKVGAAVNVTPASDASAGNARKRRQVKETPTGWPEPPSYQEDETPEIPTSDNDQEEKADTPFVARDENQRSYLSAAKTESPKGAKAKQASPKQAQPQQAPKATSGARKVNADMRTGKSLAIRLVPGVPGQEPLLQLSAYTRVLPAIRVLRVEGNTIIGETVANAKHEVYDATVRVRNGMLSQYNDFTLFYPISVTMGNEAFEAHSGWPLHEACARSGDTFQQIRAAMRKRTGSRSAYLRQCEDLGQTWQILPDPKAPQAGPDSHGKADGNNSSAPAQPKARGYAEATSQAWPQGKPRQDKPPDRGAGNQPKAAPRTSSPGEGAPVPDARSEEIDSLKKAVEELKQMQQQIITMLSPKSPTSASPATANESHV